MRIPSVFAIGRCTLGLALIVGSMALTSASTPKKTEFSVHDRAYYAAQSTVNFVRPGLTMKIVSANIAQDGTISVDYKITDPKGLPLDAAGITTPGAVSVSFIAAYIPKGQTQFFAYTTRTQTSPITNATAIQAGADSGGTTKQIADGGIRLHLQDEGGRNGNHRMGSDADAPRRDLRLAEPDGVRPRH